MWIAFVGLLGAVYRFVVKACHGCQSDVIPIAYWCVAKQTDGGQADLPLTTSWHLAQRCRHQEVASRISSSCCYPYVAAFVCYDGGGRSCRW